MSVSNWMDLARWMGQHEFATALPVPFTGHVNDHDTGCQASIYASMDGMPVIEVWKDSKWHSPIYEFNESGKVRGIQPGCEWALPSLEAFFASVAIEHAEDVRRKQEAETQRIENRRLALESAMEMYARVANKK